MEMTEEQMFVFEKWVRHYKETVITPQVKEKFLKFYRKRLQNKPCCIKRIKNDINVKKLQKLIIKLSFYDNCSLTLGTHMMQKMIPMFLKDGQITHIINEKWNLHLSRNCVFESLSLKQLYVRQRELEENPLMTIDRKFLVFENTVNLKSFDHFYEFSDVFYFCHCKRNKFNFDVGSRAVSKKSSFMDPPMCTTFLKPYVMSQSRLTELNLKKTLSSLLLPYVYVLPQLKSISIALGVKFEDVINYKSAMLGSFISRDLIREYSHLKKSFEINIRKNRTLKMFIISGGFLLHELGHINRFNDIDIYIENDEYKKQNFRLENLKDSIGENIWSCNDISEYFRGNKQIIKKVLSLNTNSNFYQLIKKFSGLRFHPPQLILYARNYSEYTAKLNQNVISLTVDYNNLDSLMVDAYNIIDDFDLPICRNALLFLDGWNYSDPFSIIYDYKRLKCHEKKNNINFKLIDQFRSDSIELNFKESTPAEQTFIEKYLGHVNWTGFGDDIYVVGLNFQSGSYKLPSRFPDKDRCLARIKKYHERCTLNNIKDIEAKPESAKLNYNVARLDWLAYKVCQNFNLHSMITCFCNITDYINQYKFVLPDYTPNSTFLKTRLFGHVE